VEWFDPNTGKTTPGQAVEGGEVRELTPPFAGEGVVYVRRGYGTRE
jgi:hypothetical protein